MPTLVAEPKSKPLYKHIATACDALRYCERRANRPTRSSRDRSLANPTEAQRARAEEWQARWERVLDYIQAHLLPSGSGFDAGIKIDRARSSGTELRLEVPFHHLSEHGYYAGWTEHRVSVYPSLVHDITMKITGRDRDQIQDYILDTLDTVLRTEYSLDDLLQETLP